MTLSAPIPGFRSRQVTVVEMLADRAICEDKTTKRKLEVPLAPRGERGLPRVGEVWIIDRSRGTYWSFQNYLAGPRPIITGSKGSGAAWASLLAAMVDLGLVVDHTTA